MKTPLSLWFAIIAVAAVSLLGTNSPICTSDCIASNLLGVIAAPVAAAAEKDVEIAANFTLKNPDGEEVSLSDFQGKIVIIDFWATWCPPCREGIPDLIKLQDEYRDQGVVVIGISFDEKAATVKKFAQENQINYPLAMGDKKVAQDYGGIQAIPTVFIIDRNGRIVDRHIGSADKEYFDDKIQPLLNSAG